MNPADKAVAFIRALRQSKGEWAGQPIDLLPWQEDVTRQLFGTFGPDGLRQYREAFIFVPRKNGKTTWVAALGLYSLLMDDEPGAEVYCAAKDADQASLVFDAAAQMVAQDPALRARLEVIDYRKRIVHRASSSFLRAIPADAKGSHGFNASTVIVDELHALPSRELVDVLKTSTAARRQPLVIYITTAGVYDPTSICFEKYSYSKAILDGTITDPHFLPVIYEADLEDDWTDPEVWAKANPSLGVTVKTDYLERQCAEAKATPSYQNTFRTLHLNVWVEQDVAWLSMDAWDACPTEPWPEERKRAARLVAGLDLSMKTDITALALLFRDGEDYLVEMRYWMPEENARQRGESDRADYLGWIRDGHVTATPGTVIDYSWIRQEIIDLTAEGGYHIREIGFDPWNAMQLAVELEEQHGIPMTQVRQGWATLSEPTKGLEALVMSGRLNHGGDPVLRWMASNVSIKSDPAGNIKPNKARSTGRIDGIVALITALSRHQVSNDPRASVYEEREILVL